MSGQIKSQTPLPAANPDITAAKAALRGASLARRDALSLAMRKTASEAFAAKPFPVPVSPGAIVSGFSAIHSEIDPMPLMLALRARGARLALPVVAGRGKPLVMREWEPGVALVAAKFGLSEPPADAPQVDPDILLVALSCFDRIGHRIGYGAGYYDMTIARLRGLKPVTAIGIAFSVQEIEAVPATSSDQKLDFLWTENELIDFRSSAAGA